MDVVIKKLKIQVQSHNIPLKEVQQRLLNDLGYLLEYLRGMAQNLKFKLLIT